MGAGYRVLVVEADSITLKAFANQPRVALWQPMAQRIAIFEDATLKELGRRPPIKTSQLFQGCNKDTYLFPRFQSKPWAGIS
jgi:hypothetical protein